jgi:hypothetical protein
MIDLKKNDINDKYTLKAAQELNDSQRQIMIDLKKIMIDFNKKYQIKDKETINNDKYAFKAAKELNNSQIQLMIDFINKDFPITNFKTLEYYKVSGKVINYNVSYSNKSGLGFEDKKSTTVDNEKEQTGICKDRC